MSSLGSLVGDISQRFGLGTKSAAFVAETVQYLFDESQGGLQGFIDRFTRAGLGEIAASWISPRDANLPVTEAQLDSAIGSRLVHRLGTELSLAGASVRTVLVYLMPKLVDLLTSEGVIPDRIPADVQSFLSTAEAQFRPMPATMDLPKRTASRGIGAWVWAVALLCLGLLSYWMLSGPQEASTPGPAAARPEALKPARLALSHTDGRVDYSGVVSDEKTRTGILDHLNVTFGASNVFGKIDIDPSSASAPWLAQLSRLLQAIKRPGTELLLEGTEIKVGTSLPEPDRSQLLSSVRSLFGPGFSIGLMREPTVADEPVSAPPDRAATPVPTLQPVDDASRLLRTLNQSAINFTAGSARITPGSRPLIARAADAIKAAPHHIAIEVSGHTDDTGDEGANKALSEARAAAVRDALIAQGVPAAKLIAKGYGSEQPVASNETPRGRQQNRRIEFRLKE